MDNLSGSSILVVTGIWSIVFIGYYVWYLWSLSRLFPKIGLPSWAGWVPVWNQWQLVQRGGLPGWLVLLGLIPFLGVVVLVVLIIAINRINSEHGKGPGFTVLGVVLPPLWAMLLANHIRDSAYAGPSAGAGQPVASGIPGFGPASTYPEQQGADWQGLPPVPAQAYQQQTPQQPQFGQPQAYAQPQQPQYAQPQQPVNPQHQLWAEPARQQVPQAPQHAPVQPAPIPPAPSAAPAAPAPTGSIPPPPPAPVPPAPASPAIESNWGFSNTTEGAFERLAAEEAQRGGNTPLGAAQSQRQFSWPSPDPTENAEIDSRPPLVLPGPPQPVQQAPVAPSPVEPEPAQAPPVVAPPAQAPRVEAPKLQEPVAQSADAAPAAPSEPSAPEPAAAPVADAAIASDDNAPSIFDTGSSRRAQDAPSAQAPTATEHTATATGAAAAAGAAAGTAATAAAGVAASVASTPSSTPDAHEDELDRTVVVVRKTRWGLELPDGEVLELVSDDVVLGRKPEAPEGAAVLQIVDPTRTMSKTHARLRRDGESWTIEDLQSTNGVAVIDELGQATQIDAGSAVAATPRLVIGTLEVKLQPLV